MKTNWLELIRDAADAGGAAAAPAAGGDKAPPPAAAPAGDAGKPADAGSSAGKGGAGQNAAPASGEPAKGGEGDKAKTTLYDDLGVDEPGKEGSASWPEDWREQMAEGNDKLLKALQRFSAPGALAKSFDAAQQKLRSGEYKRGLAEDASEAEIKAWREENGIPADAKDYDLPVLMDGKYEDLDDFGKESVDTFRSTFHELNLPPAHASKIMGVANEIAMKQMERQAEADAQGMEDTMDALRSDWGAEFKANKNLNAKFMADKFGDGWESIFTARTMDGKRLNEMPQFHKFINDLARLDGGTVLEGGHAVAGTNVEARIAEIEKIMATDWAKYTSEMKAEYSRLLATRR